MSRPGDTIGVRPAGLESNGPGNGESDAANPVAPDPDSDRTVRLVLWGISAILLAGLAAYVVRYGRNMFYWDDYELVPGLTGHQPVDLHWFFTWQNEHLVAMVRFIFFAVWKLTGDTRWMMLLVCAGFAVSAGLLLETAREIRGRQTYLDAAIPILLLSWGHYQNLIFPMQVFFAWVAALACGCLWAFVRARDGWTGTTLAVVATCLPLLPLNGVFGDLFAAPFVLLAVRIALERATARDARSRRDAVMLGLSAVLTGVVIGINVSGYHRMAHHPPADSVQAVLSSISEMLATSFGPAGIPVWPASGIAVAAFVAAACCLLVFGPRGSHPSRRIVEALVGCVAGFGALACAIGYGRAGLGPTVAFASRYSIFSAILVCLALIVFTALRTGKAGRIAGLAVLVCAIAAQPQALIVGREYGHDLARTCDRVLADLASGVPIEVVAHRQGRELYPSAEGLTYFFRCLADSGEGTVGRRARNTDPCSKELPLTPRIESTNAMTWAGTQADCVGEDPFTVFSLPAPLRVCAIRVRFRMIESPEHGPAPMQTFWAQTTRTAFTPYERTETVLLDPGNDGEQTVTFWIGDTIDRFRIDPNVRSCRFELLEMTMITQ